MLVKLNHNFEIMNNLFQSIEELFSNVYDKIKAKIPDVKFGNSFALHQVLNKNLKDIVNELAIGDFVAFSYIPTDIVNEIIKTP